MQYAFDSKYLKILSHFESKVKVNFSGADQDWFPRGDNWEATTQEECREGVDLIRCYFIF